MIRLKDLLVENWCQFSGVHKFNLSGDLNGIYGPNGAGKSNVIACIRWLLTGSSGNAGKQSDDIAHGKTSGFAKLRFDIDGVLTEVSRKLPSGECLLKYGKERVTQVSALKTRLLELLKVEHPSYLEALLVKQGTMLETIFSNPAVREQRFHKLCGISDIEAKRSAIITERSLFPDQVIVEKEEDIQESISELKDSITQNEESAKTLSSKVLSKEYLDEINDKMDRFSKHAGHQQYLSDQLATKAEVEVSYKTLLEDRISRQETVDVLEKQVAALKAPMLVATQLITAAPDRNNAFKMRNNLRVQKSQYENALDVVPPTKNDSIEGSLKLAWKCYNELSSELLAQRNIRDSLSEAEGKCPICSTVLKDKDEMIALAAQRMTKLESDKETALRQAEELREQERGYTERQHEWSIKATFANKMIADISKQLEELPEVELIGKTQLTEAKHDVENFRVVNDDWLAACAGLTGCSNACEKLEQSVNAYDTAINKTGKLMTALMPVPNGEEYELLKGDINKSNLNAGKLAAAQAKIDSDKHQLEREKVRLVKLQTARQRAKDIENYKLFLTNISNVMHRDVLQRKVVQNKRRKLNIALNSFLSTFSLPFTVVIKDDMSLDAAFTDKTIPADRLSVGQKMTLAVAYIFAEAQLFCADVGILVLDEPTAYLDKDSVVNMRELFSHVKTAAHDLGSQVFLVTHDEELKGIADNIIDVGKQEEKDDDEQEDVLSGCDAVSEEALP